MPYPLAAVRGKNELVGGLSQAYLAKILATQPDQLVACWPLNETSGTIIDDASGHGCDGTYHSVTLADSTFLDGTPVPYFDHINDYGDIYSASLVSRFNGNSLTALAWINMPSAQLHGTGVTYNVVWVNTTSNSDLLRIVKTSVADLFQVRYIGSGTTKNINFTMSSADTWVSLMITIASGTMEVFVNNVSAGTVTGLGTWGGAPVSAFIGGESSVPANPWAGYQSAVALWSTPLNSSERANLQAVA